MKSGVEERLVSVLLNSLMIHSQSTSPQESPIAVPPPIRNKKSFSDATLSESERIWGWIHLHSRKLVVDSPLTNAPT